MFQNLGSRYLNCSNRYSSTFEKAKPKIFCISRVNLWTDLIHHCPALAPAPPPAPPAPHSPTPAAAITAAVGGYAVRLIHRWDTKSAESVRNGINCSPVQPSSRERHGRRKSSCSTGQFSIEAQTLCGLTSATVLQWPSLVEPESGQQPDLGPRESMARSRGLSSRFSTIREFVGLQGTQ